MTAETRFDFEKMRRTPVPPAPEATGGPAFEASKADTIGNGYKKMTEQQLRNGLPEAKSALDALARLPCNTNR